MQVTPTPYIWMDGNYVPWAEASVHVLTPTLHYGWGVFEGIRAYPSADGPQVFRLDAHIDRLFASAELCGMAIPYSKQVLTDAVLGVTALSGMEACYIRPVIYAAPGEMGIDPTPMPMRGFIAAWPWEDSVTVGSLSDGVHACIARRRRNIDAAVPMGAKACGAYLNSAMARAEAANRDCGEAILLNPEGRVADACVANVFAVRKGRLVTPPLADGPLRGITRDTVLRVASALGYPVEERSLLPEDLQGADEVFLTGTAIGLEPVVTLDGRPIGDGRPGPETTRLYEAYRDITLSRDEAYCTWLTRAFTASSQLP